MAEEQEAAGFSYWGSERVCAACIADEALSRWVDGEGFAGECSFCGTEQRVVVTIHNLFVEMGRCIQSEYTPDATMGGPVPTLDSSDVLYNLDDPLGEETRLREVFCEAFNTEWAERDWWTGSYDERLLFGWRQFAERVKRHSRFVFMHPKAAPPAPAGLGPADIAPADILDAIHEVIEDSGLIIPLPAGQLVYRGRKHHPDTHYTTPDELGAPPPRQARSQRMNPAGISYFYAATDEATCLAELRGVEGDTATVTGWVTRRNTFGVDLVRLPEIPSIFEPEPAYSRAALAFMRRFAQEIAKSLKPYDDPVVDYVPTQILSEYIRHCVTNGSGEAVEGVIYPSPARPGGTNIVFFVDDTDHSNPDGLLVMHEEPRRYEATEAITHWRKIDGP
jgi:hypothetical protein